MEQDQITFKVTIEHCRHSNWQGKLTAGEETVEFESELELLLAMDRMMPDNGEALTYEKPMAKNGKDETEK